MPITYAWRGECTSTELNRLHADAFGTRLFSDEEWDWSELLPAHSLGWVVARDGSDLIGFVNVPWDGLAHAWLVDTMVDLARRGQGVGTQLVAAAVAQARQAGCEWLHVDFEEELAAFYLSACGMAPTRAGLLAL